MLEHRVNRRKIPARHVQEYRSQIAPADQHELLTRVAGTHDVIVDK